MLSPTSFRVSLTYHGKERQNTLFIQPLKEKAAHNGQPNSFASADD